MKDSGEVLIHGRTGRSFELSRFAELVLKLRMKVVLITHDWPGHGVRLPLCTPGVGAWQQDVDEDLPESMVSVC